MRSVLVEIKNVAGNCATIHIDKSNLILFASPNNMISRKASSELCSECLRCIQLHQRRAASSTSNRFASPAASRARGHETAYNERYEPPPPAAADWTSRSVRGPASYNSRIRPPQRLAQPGGETSATQRERQFRDVGRSRDVPARQTTAAPPQYVKADSTDTTDSNKPIKQTNFAHGSALAAFLDRSKQKSSSTSTATTTQQSTVNSGSKATSLPSASASRLRVRSRTKGRPSKRIHISSVASVATLAKLMNLKLRKILIYTHAHISVSVEL